MVLVLYVSEFRFRGGRGPLDAYRLALLFKYTIVYSSFAFILSVVREVVKDIEDMEGDMKYNCRTMPIVWGVNVAKVFAGTWLPY